MPVLTEHPSAGQTSSKLASQEPALQRKKRIEPMFLKTTPAKSDFDGVPLQSKMRVPSPSNKPTPMEPVMQAKKRVVPDFAKTAPVDSSDTVPIQSKKRMEPVSSEKADAIHCEPPLQRKKRVPVPSASLTNGFYENGQVRDDDYALLGNQDKFSENIRYRPRSAVYSRDISPPKQMKLQKKQKENKAPSPSRAPVVDTDIYKQPPTPLAPRKPKDQSDPELQKLKSFKESQETKVTRSPKQSQSEPKISKSRKEEPSTAPSQKAGKPEGPAVNEDVSKGENVEQTKPEQKVEQKQMQQHGILKPDKKSDLHLNLGSGDEAHNLDRRDPVKDSMKSKRIVENMNEFAQTNLEKGVADSAPEAPADYALRYKTGIAAPRPSKKMSEYQKQFQWKAGLPASPLLKAEQIVYNSNPQLSPPKKSVIPKVTEYQKQFKPYRLVPSQKPEDVAVPVAPKKTKLQRSKSLEGLSPAEIQAAGSAPVISPDNKRLTLESGQKMPEPVPEVPKKKSRHVRSEYDSNFKDPSRFSYVRGSWHGAPQPHIQLKGPEPSTQTPAVSNWFAEVIELRRKAQEYRKRALGTHFSRDHLAQLLAQQNDLWDASSTTARSTLSALSLESGLQARKASREPKEPVGEPQKDYSVIASLASEDDQSSARLHEFEQQQQQMKQAWVSQEEADSRLNQQTPSSFSDDELPREEVVEGRLPTPKIRDQVRSGKSPTRRHHLDRTTPTVGGAILSSPPDSRKKKTGKRMVAKSADSVSLGTAEDLTPRNKELPGYKPLAGQKTHTLSAMQGPISLSPTFGKPSRDTHCLRDDDASTDRELVTQYVDTPAKPRETPGGLHVIDEGFGETYNKSRPASSKSDRKPARKPYSWVMDGGIPIPRVDEDAENMSLSTRSIASSCSLASETLERARKRKEEFWGNQTVKAK